MNIHSLVGWVLDIDVCSVFDSCVCGGDVAIEVFSKNDSSSRALNQESRSDMTTPDKVYYVWSVIRRRYDSVLVAFKCITTEESWLPKEIM